MKKEEKENRFTYSSDKGLKVVSKGTQEKEEKEQPKKIKKGYETWL